MGSNTILSDKDLDVQRVLDALRSIVQELRTSAASCEKRFGLSAAQLFVLHVLREEQDLSLGELSGRTMTHQSSVSVVVRKLEEKGLIVKALSEGDRRKLVLRLTPAGRRLASRAPKPVQESLIQQLQAMGRRDRRTLSELLERIRPRGLDMPSMFFEEETGSRKKRR
jgi:DNA-binding MarR family transcriptional regulator